MNRPRVILYWALLLLPALAVGGVAIGLLYNEQRRIEASSLETLEAQGQTIVDNIDLIVAEMKDGLMGSLATFPGKGLKAELASWKDETPLVAEVLMCSPVGEVLLPDPKIDPAKSDLAYLKKDGCYVWDLPYKPATGQGAGAILPQQQTELRGAETGEAAAAQVRQGAAGGEPTGPVQVEVEVQQKLSGASLAQADGEDPGPQLVAASTYRASKQTRSKIKELTASKFNPQKGAAAPPAEAGAPPAPEDGDEPAKDWVYHQDEGGLRLVAWFRTGARDVVRGLEVSTDSFNENVRGAFPDRVNPAGRFVLRDALGRVVHSAGGGRGAGASAGPVNVAGAKKADAEPDRTLPVGPELPGWQLELHQINRGSLGQGFFLIGSVLVAILVISSFTGGTLLMWQAQKNSLEAARKTTFVSNVSHELKTPLTSIRMYAEMLGEGRVTDEAKKQGYLNVIVAESQRLARLVNNVLDFSRLEQGKKVFRLEEEDLPRLVNHVLDTQEMRIEEAGMRLGRVVPAAPLTARVDRDAFEQVMINLLDNAVKYARGGGGVSVSVEAAEGGGSTIAVEDSGPGVPAAHREAIFDIFHRVDDSLTRREPGTGLGLSIARRLVQGFGGDLVYRPARAGDGARFEIRLPGVVNGAGDRCPGHETPTPVV